MVQNSSARPPCWFCGNELDPATIERQGHLVPRRTTDGGPLWLIPCPACETPNGAERNAGGDFLLVPCVDPGIPGWVASLFDGPRTILRAHALTWWQKNEGRRRAFHSARPRPRPVDEPAGGESTPPRPRIEPETPPSPGPSPGVAVLLEHYRTLGLSLTATREEIVAAFRKQGARCHPDKVAHLDEEFQRLADRKFREIREAYEAILAEVGESGPS